MLERSQHATESLGHVRDLIEIQLRPMIPDYDDRQDVTQVCLISVWRKIGSFQGRSRFTSWLHIVVKNEFLAWQRRMDRRARLARSGSGWNPAPVQWDFAEQVCASVLVERYLQRMSPTDRMICELRFLAGMSSVEVGAQLGLAAGSVRCRTARLVVSLRRDPWG